MQNIIKAVSFYSVIQSYKEYKKRSFTSASLADGGDNVGRKRRKTLDLCSVCFLCEEQDQGLFLRKAVTMELNDKQNRCAGTLNDEKLLAKLTAGDEVAFQLNYHPAYLAALYNKKRSNLKGNVTRRVQRLAIRKEAISNRFLRTSYLYQ